MYYDSEGTVIYVGKAKNLKRRVSSYFNRTHDSLRTNLLVRAIADMSYIVVPTEQDALNLEASMIKEYQPRYNVLLKDDKSYPWIVVTNEPFPRVFMTRQRIKDGSKYYGPYTDAGSARATLDLVRHLYRIRSCRHLITPDYVKAGKGRLCLDYHLKRCGGCCTGLVSSEEYCSDIDRVRAILRGDVSASLSHTLVPSSHHSRLCKGRQGEIVSRLPSKTMRRVLHRTCLVGGILLGYRPGPCHTPWRCLRASRLSAGRDGEIVVRASFRGGAGAKGAV